MPDRTAVDQPGAAIADYVISVEEYLAQGFDPACGRIICGDALSVLPYLPEHSIDLIHTSPPYNIKKPYASEAADNAPTAEFGPGLRSG